MTWADPTLLFLDGFWRWFVILLVVYYTIRAVAGNAVLLLDYIGDR